MVMASINQYLGNDKNGHLILGKQLNNDQLLNPATTSIALVGYNFCIANDQIFCEKHTISRRTPIKICKKSQFNKFGEWLLNKPIVRNYPTLAYPESKCKI